jgi:hypothetical protein
VSRIPAALAILSLAGCPKPKAAPPAPPPTPTVSPALRQAVGRVELCRTTEGELRKSFGEPMRDGRLHEGRILSWLLGKDVVERIFAVYLNASGVVVDIAWDVPGLASWVPVDGCSARR